LGSYLRDASQEGSADVVVCLHIPRSSFPSGLGFPLFFFLLGGLHSLFL
jgi:hypothetical protein